ncbi:MAG: YcaO-like family protein [Myxococcales bacterium]|nr:YcaO-like family protein [Myxococcales bacterium]
MSFGDHTLALSGVSSSTAAGEQVTGSAACWETAPAPLPRSYFELLERVSVVDALRNRERAYVLRDRDGRILGSAGADLVFPQGHAPERSRASRSNGVAIHVTWETACDRACAELVERDRILRSWYGELVPSPLPLGPGLVPDAMRIHSEWLAYELGASGPCVGADLAVVLVIAFPARTEVPLVFGAAAASDRRTAVTKAIEEAIQRFGFLFGEAIPDTPPESAPTPDYHQEFYLYPPHHRLLRDWLERRAAAADAPSGAGEQGAPRPVSFVDLTPPHLRGDLFVAKALSIDAEPLWFGEPAPHRAAVTPERRVHPVA